MSFIEHGYTATVYDLDCEQTVSITRGSVEGTDCPACEIQIMDCHHPYGMKVCLGPEQMDYLGIALQPEPK